ncbi:CBS domain containing protein [Acanthamoeba castellanii str. Neff]|uniref:CBS domain containing protein n=1 Tax=Acanthamoeba castellanii (strain ATCC 30010 / Neff) TaxID=1257118 RepID=L8GIP6_ACACF|nr:CBS domain containing protein [Acanthamoeba castellanii str. Neff]ELR12719.1 CBS domain containing protein [Acanthamoeba castellanii str. Neff]
MEAQRRFLEEAKLSQVVENKPALVWVEPSTTVASVCDELRLHNILSLPVYSKETNEFVGIANVADIALFIAWGSVDLVRKQKEDKPQMSEMELVPRLKFADRPITSFFCIFDASDSVYSVLEPLSKGYHRALVRLTPQASKPEDYRLLTQTDIVRFLFANRDKLDQALLSQTVAQAGLVQGRKNMLCVSEDEALNVLQAFRRMTQRDMNCIGICDKSGRLVCNLSASDLRGMAPDRLKMLLLPVRDYLTAMYGETLCHKLYPITCAPDAKLADVMESVLAHKVHRVWVVDETEQPVGLVSLSDIICKFSPYDYKASNTAPATITSLH